MDTDKHIATIDEFIASYPSEIQEILEKVRQTIRRAAPDATEKISYGIPTFVLHGNLVHFAAYKTHVGFYPGADGIKAFETELKAYETSKGTVRFPFSKPLPYELIEKITLYRAEQQRK